MIMEAPVLTLTLDSDNPINTAILSPDGKPLYRVNATRIPRGSAIRVYDRSGANVATLETTDIGWGSSKVRIGEREPVAYGKWLSRSIVPFERDVTMKDERGRKYKWRENGLRKTLQLYTAEDGTHPIAAHHRTVGGNGSLVSTLALDARADELRDQVVASFVFLERERRVRERAAENKAVSEADGQLGSYSFLFGLA
ncbi:hypothetical protein DAEQUDRAFT_390284 [Daedalea quercina L-15889]|uniref:DUF6593 domain-containing protein n=1 Tax=Daedalea quercina L-15889 TaxID=1314783 RepID=A0A165NUN9_9APHY|nr:hypothetical protein DAEQUDRAFT_390284 [Daedalea quercina L-15889]